MYRVIDTHAHLDELKELDSALEKAKNAGVIAIIAVGSNHQSNIKTLTIWQEHDGFVYPALGLHPWELGSLSASEIDENLRFIEQNIASAVAVGEIGLDYDKRVVKVAPKQLQQEVLSRLLDIARRHAKPAIIHSRYAWILRDIIDAGYFISATPAAEYHEEHIRAVKEAPLNGLLLETDCPVTYGRAARYESQPADVLRSLEAVSGLKGIDKATLAEQTVKNAVEFFSLNTVF